MEDDNGLDSLLSLNGQIFYMDDGDHWVKFIAHKVAITKHIPHGISYSLTLHDRNNTRIVGYDNAHKCKPKGNKHKSKVVTWDHSHQKDRVRYYEFESAAQLIEDFWKTIYSFVR